jgi:hypothetical protein
MGSLLDGFHSAGHGSHQLFPTGLFFVNGVSIDIRLVGSLLAACQRRRRKTIVRATGKQRLAIIA